MQGKTFSKKHQQCVTLFVFLKKHWHRITGGPYIAVHSTQPSRHVIVMQQPLEIRLADREDINTIGFLAQQIWPEAYKDILSPKQIHYMLNQMYSPEALIDQMTNQHHIFLLAESADEALGFAAYAEIAPGIVKLHKLYVLTGIQGKGIGKALLEFILEEIQANGAHRLQLNVNRNNKARKFYEKLGFQIIREEDIDIGNGYFMNDFVLEKKIKI